MYSPSYLMMMESLAEAWSLPALFSAVQVYSPSLYSYSPMYSPSYLMMMESLAEACSLPALFSAVQVYSLSLYPSYSCTPPLT
jgi:hypothetical protein